MKRLYLAFYDLFVMYPEDYDNLDVNIFTYKEYIYLIEKCVQRKVGLFRRARQATKTYDKEKLIPAIKASICNGEQVAGFKNIHTGKFEDVMLIKSNADIETFKHTYEITGDIEKIY